MAAIVPSGHIGKLDFYEAHLAPWATNAAALSFSIEQINDMTTLTQAARAAYTAKEQAADAAKAATETFYEAVGAMHGLGSGLIGQVKNKAKLDADPSLYQLAQIPLPSDPTPAGDPVAPTNVRAGLVNGGAIDLTWDGTVARRQFFSVWRSLGSGQSATYEQIGAVAGKSFTDDTIPRGAEQAQYYVRAQRDTKISAPSAQLLVTFGVAQGGAVSVRVGGPKGTLLGDFTPQGQDQAGGAEAKAAKGGAQRAS